MSEWRPISEAPDTRWLVCGKYGDDGGWTKGLAVGPLQARADGYTHYLPEPAPPAQQGTEETVTLTAKELKRRERMQFLDGKLHGLSHPHERAGEEMGKTLMILRQLEAAND